MAKVIYWVDATWCLKEEYSEAQHGWKSDDIGKLEVSENASDAEIDQLVHEATGNTLGGYNNDRG